MRQTLSRGFFFIFFLLSFYLQIVKADESSTPSVPPSLEIAKPRDYEAIGQPNDPVYLTQLKLVYSGHTHNQYIGKLSLVPNPDKSDFFVPFLYYKARQKGPRPFLVIPPSLEGITILEKGAAIYFASKGVSSLVFKPAFIIQDMHRRVSEIDGLFKVALFSLKMIVDWAHTRPEEFDLTKAGAFGMSLGGILSSVLLGQDSRIKAGYLVVAGGDLPSILAKGKTPFLNRYRWKRIRDEGLNGTKGYEEALRLSMTLDPLSSLAIPRTPDNIFMIMARGDQVVPFRNQKQLWRTLGKPKFRMAPFGHPGGVMKVPFSLNAILNFFWKNWGPQHLPLQGH